MSIIAQGCFHPVTKVQSASLHFFLGGDEEQDDSDDEDEVGLNTFVLSNILIRHIRQWTLRGYNTDVKSTKNQKRGQEVEKADEAGKEGTPIASISLVTSIKEIPPSKSKNKSKRLQH